MGFPALLAVALLPALQSPLLPPAERLVPVPARDVHLAAGSFWGPRVATNLLASLQHGAAMLEQHGQFGNFRMAASKQGHALPAGSVAPEKYAGCFYYDSDAYKWLEACCLALQQDAPEGTDPQAVATAKADIRLRVDRFVEEIAAAQREDGYLNTQYLVEGWEPFTKLGNDHELYCAGHLIQAAIAHQQATGNRRLMDVALRFAELIDRTFGPREGQRPGACGHPELETALVQLFRHTGERRWLDLAAFMLECRGKGLAGGDDYRQDDKPIREQREARGHAVRQLYLCSGVLGVGEETGDAGLIDANLAIWKDIVAGKLYVTGGLGARPDGEAFGAPFELPNERAYSETCASVAWMRWNHELLQATGDGKYADALETTLYNAFLASTSKDGKSFFYVNPLESRGGHVRQPWYWCACCPPNVMRTFAGLPGWVASTTQDTLWIHLYDDCTIDATLGNGNKVKVRVQRDAEIQQTGKYFLFVEEGPADGFDLALRVPAWCTTEAAHERKTLNRGYELVHWPVDGGPHADPFAEAVMRHIGGSSGCPMEVQVLAADPRVVADRGCVAFRRGPVVYAFTSATPGDDVAAWQVDPLAVEAPPAAARDVPQLRVAGLEQTHAAPGQLYGPASRPPARVRTLTAVPYSAWADVPDATMRVWMPALSTVPDFADDVAFLQQHADAVVLRAEGGGPIVVSPKLTARVMTSSFADGERGFGLVNREAILAGPVARGFANYGGEDRLWLSPEGGPAGLFFEPGAAQVPEHWSVPAWMDGGPRSVATKTSSTIVFKDVMPLGPDLSAPTGVRVTRTIEALPRVDIATLLGRDLPASVRLVAFQSRNAMSWNDVPPQNSILGLWTLGQFTPSDRTTVLFPFRPGGLTADPDTCIKRDYFGVVPEDRLEFELPGRDRFLGLARFKADSRLRSKIGLSRAGALGWIGAWDEDRGVLTLVNHSLPPEGAPVPDCDWRVPNPRAAQGDVATSYNNGGEPAFFELESLSAALPAERGASVEHVSTTIHLGGDREVLREIARTMLHAEL